MASPPSRRDDPALPMLTVAAVARRLGVAPPTLRTWDRRYGLGPSAHTAGAHRRYSPADLARLTEMRRLTLEGVAPAEAARVALAVEVQTDSAGSPGVRPSPPPPVTGPPRPPDRIRSTTTRRGGGGVVALPDGSPEARGLARAAMALDSGACADIVRAGLRRRGVVSTWDGLLVPVLVGIGRRWEGTGRGVDVEHLLSECVTGCLRAVIMRLREPVNARPVLLACAEEEQHALPVHALAAALAERQVDSRILGPRVPRDALAAAVRRSGPAAVFVWSQLPATGAGALLGHLPTLRPPTAVIAGGPGWRPDTLPDRVARVGSLGQALTLVVAATGG